jgi:hypothetical protein
MQLRGACVTLLLLAAIAVCPSAASATTVTLSPTDACWLLVYPPDDCEGGPYLSVGEDVQGYTRHSFLKFDEVSSIPANAVVTSATLSLLQADDYGSIDPPVSAWQMTSDWSSFNMNWFNFSTPGGDFGTEVDSQFPNGDGQLTQFNVTQLVADWVDGSAANYGIGLTVPDANAFMADYVVEYSTAELDIDYTVPCPSDPFAAAQSSTEGPVHQWNQYLLSLIRTETPPSIRLSPTWSSRAAAMLNVGIFDTLNSVYFAKLEDLATATPTSQVCGWESYLTLAETDPDTDGDLAAGYAAKAILTALYPHKATAIATQFNTIHNTPSLDQDAFDLGSHVASEVLAARNADGSGAGMSYTPATTTPGAWRASPTISTEAPCTNSTAVTPGWGNVTPFALTSGSQFRQPLPGGFSSYSALLASSYYANQVNEVKQKGKVNAPTTDRSNDETQAAWFWANDLDGTYKPPGQLLEHTRLVAMTQPAAQATGDPVDFLTTWSRQGIRVAHLYAEVSLAMADGAIAAWDMKYNTAIDLWRPIDAIRQADTDGTTLTVKDASWEPLSRDRVHRQFSPCFPAWASGHATFGGAWSRAMENEFEGVQHTNPFPLMLTTEDPHAVGVTRSFGSFAEAGEENAESRIWLGVHYRVDAEDGLTAGRGVADHVDATRLRPAQTCAGWACADPIP